MKILVIAQERLLDITACLLNMITSSSSEQYLIVCLTINTFRMEIADQAVIQATLEAEK
jgi:hypothetical protein